MIEVEVLKHSVSEFSGIRLLTMRWRYPKFIHGEVMTHRVFSRNASSSRAIPTSKYIEEAERDDLRAEPVVFTKNQKGMQGVALTGDEEKAARTRWKKFALRAAADAREALEAGEHKQSINRMLDSYVHINVIVSSTGWLNFLGLRLDSAADPTMRALAEKVFDAYKNAPVATPLKFGEWHLPYIAPHEFQDLEDDEDRKIVASARCARVSYLSFETLKPSTLDEDRKRYALLAGSQPIHASPLEHVATPDEFRMCEHDDECSADDFYGRSIHWMNKSLHGNFTGWCQHRKMVKGENCAPLPKGYEL